VTTEGHTLSTPTSLVVHPLTRYLIDRRTQKHTYRVITKKICGIVDSASFGSK